MTETTRRSRTTRFLDVAMLNSGPYVTPDDPHTYAAVLFQNGATIIHVPGCAQAIGTSREWTGTGAEMHHQLNARFGWCFDCMSHRLDHVTLPDGSNRYRPAGPIGVGDWGDPAYAEWAVIAQHDGGWQVTAWTVTQGEAKDRAAAAGPGSVTLTHRNHPCSWGVSQ